MERRPLIGTLVTCDFPVSPNTDDRRRTSRCPVQFEILYGIGDNLIAGEGYDFGGGGLGFIGPKQYPSGAELELRYRLQTDQEWIKVRALVRHRQGNRMGVEFLTPRIK